MKLKPHLRNGRFYNYEHESITKYLKSIAVTIRHMLKKKPPFFTSSKEETLASWTTTPTFKTSPDGASITWLGHASFLCQLGGYNIIADPVFGQISRLYPRMIPSPLEHATLPKIDVVIISHNHHDHLDKKSLSVLQKHDPLFFVPQGDKAWFDKRGFTRVIEYDWWEQHSLPARINNQPVIVQFLPSHHWSGRGLLSINKSLWGSWLLSHSNQSIYIGGDTAYSKHFKVIGDALKKIDIAILPIGPCQPIRAMIDSHIDPQQALQAFLDLGATHFIPMHWGTFKQGLDNFDYAINTLNELWPTTITDQDKQLHLVKFGETKQFEHISLE